MKAVGDGEKINGPNLLLVTFVLDNSHPSLSWQVHVARRLAERVGTLTILTSRVGCIDPMPENVEIVVPPNRPLGIPLRYGGRWAFNREIYNLCRTHQIDAVLVHMAKDWTYQLKPVFSLLGIPVVLWYAHGSVTSRLRLAVWCADRVITSTPEGCRLPSSKINVIGQAVDTELFSPPEVRRLRNVLAIGRISRRKRVDLIYSIAKELRNADIDTEGTEVVVVGASRTMDDLQYEYKLRSQIWQDEMETTVRMVGHVPHGRIPEFYEDAFVHLNVSETGSMDKTVMEALASGCPVLTSNPAFRKILRNYPEFIIHDERPEAIAEQISHIYRQRYQYDPKELSSLVGVEHSLHTYADRILSVFDDVLAV